MYIEILMLIVLINNINTQNNEICPECVAKCCPINQYVLDRECKPKTSNVPDFSTIGVYDDNLIRIGNLIDLYTIVSQPFFKEAEVNTTGFINEGQLNVEYEGEYVAINNTNYCLDFYSKFENTTTEILFWVVNDDTSSVLEDRFWPMLKLAALLITCFFLLLVILAYLLVKQLRDLKGKIRLAFVTNLFGLYVTLGCVQVYFSWFLNGEVTDNTCLFITTISYFFYWASCCWMNVSTYNIWVSIRGFRAVAVNQPQFWDKDRRLFLKFCVYSYVVPCVLVVTFITLYFLKDTSEIIRAVVTNGECSSVKNKETNFIYFIHITMIIINLVTLVLYVHIANFLSLRGRESRRQLKHVNRKNMQMGLLMHIKIWTLTGMTWILDAVTIYFVNDSKVWDILEIFSLSSGIGLFVIIICNRQTLHLIYERFKKVEH